MLVPVRRDVRRRNTRVVRILILGAGGHTHVLADILLSAQEDDGRRQNFQSVRLKPDITTRMSVRLKPYATLRPFYLSTF